MHMVMYCKQNIDYTNVKLVKFEIENNSRPFRLFKQICFRIHVCGLISPLQTYALSSSALPHIAKIRTHTHMYISTRTHSYATTAIVSNTFGPSPRVESSLLVNVLAVSMPESLAADSWLPCRSADHRFQSVGFVGSCAPKRTVFFRRSVVFCVSRSGVVSSPADAVRDEARLPRSGRESCCW